MNYRVLLLGLCVWGSLPVLGQESRVEDIRIGGFVGGRIHTCIEQRVKSQDVEHLESLSVIAGRQAFGSPNSLGSGCWGPFRLTSIARTLRCWSR